MPHSRRVKRVPRKKTQPKSESRRLSRRLQSTLQALSQDISGLVEKTLAVVQAEIPEYSSLRDPAVLGEVRRMVELNAQGWYGWLLFRRPATRYFEAVAELARRRAHQGIPLSALLRSFRVGARTFWETILQAAAADSRIQPEVLFRLSLHSRLFHDTMMETVTEAYTSELSSRAYWRDRARNELCQIVFSSSPDEEAFRARIMTLGFDPTTPILALALRFEHPLLAGYPAVDRRTLIDRGARIFGVGVDRVVEGVRHGDLILWGCAPMDFPVTGGTATLSAGSNPCCSGPDGLTMMGVGIPAVGLRGWRSTAEQATRALELGAHLRPRERIHCYKDLAAYDVAFRTPEIADFLAYFVQRLSAEADVLLRSAAVYFSSASRVKVAAATLKIHPNTLAYRLKRLEKLLNGSFDDPDWSLHFQLALKLYQLRGATPVTLQPTAPE